MAGKLTASNTNAVNIKDPVLARAYCEGRKAKKAAGAGTPTNPYTSGTPEYTAFDNGVSSWVNGGTDGARDHCDDLPRAL